MNFHQQQENDPQQRQRQLQLFLDMLDGKTLDTQIVNRLRQEDAFLFRLIETDPSLARTMVLEAMGNDTTTVRRQKVYPTHLGSFQLVPVHVPFGMLEFLGGVLVLAVACLVLPLLFQGVLDVTLFMIVLIGVPILMCLLWIFRVIEFKSSDTTKPLV